ncbi:MAG: GSCFA domain-containing protein [Bacteroidetes bacterium]|nr:GSCFA domain-containing protein [Bacteroidota bacterium]
MQLHLTLDIPPLSESLSYRDSILLVGSCFTEHIYDRLQQHRFKVLSNPHGILFNPLSVADSINSYIDEKVYDESDLFYLNELWNSWDHHTRFSHIDKQAALTGINDSQQAASAFIREANWVIITLGSAFQYHLKENDKPVANNHRAPAQWFEKRLLTIHEIINALDNTLTKLFAINPGVRVLFTISPVRHIRDGVVDNNRSKARLIEAVHELCNVFDSAFYFPAYELVIDILRDYRYYDIDFVHPNYMATTYVWEHFVGACMSPETRQLMEQVHEIVTARNHRPRFPETEAHQKFMKSYTEKVQSLMAQHPYLDLGGELAYFSA